MRTGRDMFLCSALDDRQRTYPLSRDLADGLFVYRKRERNKANCLKAESVIRLGRPRLNAVCGVL